MKMEVLPEDSSAEQGFDMPVVTICDSCITPSYVMF